MIKVDEEEPIGEVELSFPNRDVVIKRGIDPKQTYDLQEELGRGKFGTVYRCKDKSNGLCLAAKFVSVPKKEDRRNVEREVDIMRQLQHPRLIQIYDAFENGRVMCVILELIEGGELFERVIDDDFILTEKSCTIFMRQICEGIEFIHKQNILHLDMKPENILCLTKTGNRIKIIDFGLARKFDPNKKLQVLFGTPEFVAPEVVNFDQIGYGTDMWSIGVICYVLLSGLSPFMGHTDVETMANVTIAKYDFDDEAFQDISENAKDFIRKLLIKDMNERMSAEQCLNHAWLKRKMRPPKLQTSSSSMDVTKDNLRQFVERWNEHPNSPYVFESTNHRILANASSGVRLSSRSSSPSHSLSGMSPSPCESLASSIGDDDDAFAYDANEVVNSTTSAATPCDHYRRASDSSYVLRGTDVAERINLAEEIKKLSDKLFKLSTMSTTITNTDFARDFDTSFAEVSSERCDVSETIKDEANAGSSIRTKMEESTTRIRENAVPKSEPIDVRKPRTGEEVPWRRPKFKINNMSRDVPLLTPKNKSSPSFHEQFNARLSLFNRLDAQPPVASPNDTKDMLLRLLEQWDDARNGASSGDGGGGGGGRNKRHASMSSEWSESDALGQKTISSLNMFFQSRSTNKKSTHFRKT